MTLPPALPRRRRVVNRLLVAIVAAGLVTGVIGAALLQRAAHDSALDDAGERTQLVANQYAVRLDSSVDSLLATLHLASTRRELTELVPTASDELAVVLRASPSFDELVLFDRTGVPVAAAASRFLADPADIPERADLVIGVETADYVAIEPGSPSDVALAVSIENPPGQVRGALLARARLDVVAAPLEESLRVDDPVPFLVGADGDVLVHRDRGRVNAAFPIERLLSNGGQDRFELDGERRLFAVAHSERLGADVVVEQPEAVALVPVDERRDELIVILVAATAATALAVAIAGEILLRPLRPLTLAVSRVGRGERGVRTNVRGTGEIGMLATEIDRMAESLDRRDEQISELRDVSLLVGSLADQADVARRIAEGAARLVRGDAAAVLAADSSDVVGATEAYDIVGDENRIEAHLVGGDGATLGSLCVFRDAAPFSDEDADLLTAFARFGSVALDNARRLGLQQELVEQLQAAIDQRRDLIGTITHEFRTPLACIEGFTAELLDGWNDYGDDERQDLIARIRRHGSELDELVSRFLDFTVTERGGMSATLETLSITEVIENAVTSLAPLLVERRVEVDVVPVQVTADRVLIRRTLTNLLSNAVKFSAPGSAVCIRARTVGNVAEIAVIDEGIGMEPADLARAFEPFWRAGAPSTRSTRGAGLGLALVAEYVRVMGGTVRAEAAPGLGSTFTFTVPVASVPSSGRGGRGG